MVGTQIRDEIPELSVQCCEPRVGWVGQLSWVTGPISGVSKRAASSTKSERRHTPDGITCHKAKKEPACRFDLFYDNVQRAHLLERAYRCGKSNKRAGEVDDEEFCDIEASGEERWLWQLTQQPSTRPTGRMRSGDLEVARRLSSS
jgi:hypothetical protein